MSPSFSESDEMPDRAFLSLLGVDTDFSVKGQLYSRILMPSTTTSFLSYYSKSDLHYAARPIKSMS